jgi:hypothetical protein
MCLHSINKEALAVLSRIVAGENLSCDPNAWSNLQQLSPVLFDVLSKYGSAEIPVQFTTLLQVLIDKAIGFLQTVWISKKSPLIQPAMNRLFSLHFPFYEIEAHTQQTSSRVAQM